MNKKEILEIKKILAKDKTRIDRISGCYVDGDKQKKTFMSEAFLSLPEEEMFKYSDIFRKTLSGSLGKNLLNTRFSAEDEEKCTSLNELNMLKQSGLKDEALLNAFYDRFIETYLDVENQLILLAHGLYDVPQRGKDSLEQFDASDYVYEFLICCVCPVTFSKAGLMYDSYSNSFVDKGQDLMVDMPQVGFLYPAFNDRNTDRYGLLYYAKNAEQLHSELMDSMLGCGVPDTANDQKIVFNTMVEETFGRDCDFEVVKAIHDELMEMLEERKDDPEPFELDRMDVKKVLEKAGADEEQIEHFEESFETDEDKSRAFMASNITQQRKFEVKSKEMTIQLAGDRTDLIETRVIDGREYILIPVTGDIEVNGIRIHSARMEDEEV